MCRLAKPRLRIESAKAHQARIAQLWNDFIDGEEPYAVDVRVDDAGWGSISVFPNGLPTDEISIELGELLYQLRAALDSMVYELAIIDSGRDPPPDAEKLEFPVRESEASFENAAWKIAPLSDDHRRLISLMQPYPVADQSDTMKTLGATFNTLNDWARKDRHRGVHLVASWASNRSPIIEPPEGCHIDFLEVAEDGALERESEIATFHVSGWRPNMDLVANPNLAIDIAINEAPLPNDAEDTLSRRVRFMIGMVEAAISLFESTL